MGSACDGSDPTDPVECGNSQHSPASFLKSNIGPLLQGPLASTSDFVQVSETRNVRPMDVHRGSGWAVLVMALTQQTLWSVATASTALQQSLTTTLVPSSQYF
jgi:hypothetical protein